MIYIIAAILIFGVLIAVHELGHFLAAKACGVRVNEFSIGMGPTILHKTKGDTTYSLRLLPIGGFCAMEGEEEDSNDPTALNNQSFSEKTHHFCRRGLYELSDGPGHHRRPVRRGQGILRPGHHGLCRRLPPPERERPAGGGPSGEHRR